MSCVINYSCPSVFLLRHGCGWQTSSILAQGWTNGLIAISFLEPPHDAGVFVVQQICRICSQILQKSPKNIRKTVISDGFNGADGWIRTDDLILTNDVGKAQSNQFANPIVFCAGPGQACLKPVIITVSCHIRAALHETPDAWNIPSCIAA